MAESGHTQLALFGGDEVRTAVLSDCKRYRYELIRRWADGPLLEFVMLNPSTADAAIDDPTVLRCVAFAKAWGYGGIVVRNLFAFRATNPKALLTTDDPVGPNNMDYLVRADADCTVVAWGANSAVTAGWKAGRLPHLQAVLERPNGLFCLGVNANGSPKHPLYIKGDARPVPWVVPDAA